MSQEPVYRHLTDDGLVGDGTNHIAAVNGVVTPVPFWVGPTEFVWSIHRMIIMIEDAGNLAADNYGAITALANGVNVSVRAGHQTTGDLVIDLCDGDDISNHVGWAEHCYDATDHAYGSGNNFIVARWTFSDAGRPLILDSSLNEKIVVTVNDDLTGLVDHQFQIQGHSIYSVAHPANTWGAG